MYNYRIFYPSNEHEFSYNFDAVLYQFLETGTSDRCLIYKENRIECIYSILFAYIYRSTPGILRFHPIPPFTFHLQSL